MKKIWIWLFAVLLIPGILSPGKTIDREISELEEKLKKASGKEKADILDQVARKNLRRAPQKTIQYGKQLLDLSRKLKYPEGEAHAFINIGMGYSIGGSDYEKALECYHKALKWYESREDRMEVADTVLKIGIVHKNQGRYNKALKYYRDALKIFEEQGYTKGIAKAYNNMGIVYDDFGELDKALDYYLKSAKIHERSEENRRSLAGSFTNIGTIYWRLKNYEKALDYYKKTLAIDEETGNKVDIASSLNNIGMVYMCCGKSDLALEYYHRSLEMKKEIGVRSGTGYTISNIGALYYSKKQYSQALKYFFKGLTIMKKLGDQNGIAGNLGNIGRAYMKLGQLDRALPYLEQCIKIAGRINAQNLLRDHYKNLSQLYEAKGNHKKALEHFKLFQKADKTIFNDTSSRQIARLQTQYDTEKKELKIKSLEREKRIRTLEDRWKAIISGALLLALVIVSIVIYRAYKYYKAETSRKEETLRKLQRESRLKLFLAGIDKHFLFNSLDSIMGLETIPDRIKDNLKKLSELYRYVLTSTEKLVIPLREELEVVKHYLEIEQKILEGRLFFEISKVEDHLLDCEIMPQTILTMVENAVKHGILKKETGGTVSIDIYQEKKSLVVKITDTGIGIQQGIVNTGFGIYSLRERLRLYYKNRANFILKPRAEGGTQAIMEVPYVPAYVK